MQIISEYLTFNSILRLASVNRAWYQLFQEEEVWKNLSMLHYPDFLPPTVPRFGWKLHYWLIQSFQVVSFGNNSHRKLCLSSNYLPDSYIPKYVGLYGIRQVCAGTHFSLILDFSGRVRIFGDWTGWLEEDPEKNPEESSREILIAGQSKIIQISVGLHHGLLLDQSGRVWSLGANNVGQAGKSNLKDSLNLPKIVQISAAANYSCFLDLDGGVWFCGHNQGLYHPRESPVKLISSAATVVFEPVLIPNLPPISKIWTTPDNIVLVHQVTGITGITGIAVKKLDRSVNIVFPNPTIIRKSLLNRQILSCSHSYLHAAVAQDNRGKTQTFIRTGRLTQKIGLSDSSDKAYKDHVLADLEDILAVDGGLHHLIFLNKSGQALGLGSNLDGRLGCHPDIRELCYPQRIDLPLDSWALSVSSSIDHNLLVVRRDIPIKPEVLDRYPGQFTSISDNLYLDPRGYRYRLLP